MASPAALVRRRPIKTLLRRQRDEVASLEDRSVEKISKLFKSTQADLERELRKYQGDAADSFTAQHFRIALARVKTIVRASEDKLAKRDGSGAIVEASEAARDLGLDHLEDQIATFSREFDGEERPVDLGRVSRTLDDSLLERHEASVRGYGLGGIERIKAGLAEAQLSGSFPRKAVDKVLERTGFSPSERWRAERIVRTELAFSYSAAAVDGLREAEEDDPGYRKKLVSTLDDRTGTDSVFVNGQVRKLDEEFEDDEGRRYDHPPNRPNDREVVVATRDEWEEGDASPLPEDEDDDELEDEEGDEDEVEDDFELEITDAEAKQIAKERRILVDEAAEQALGSGYDVPPWIADYVPESKRADFDTLRRDWRIARRDETDAQFFRNRVERDIRARMKDLGLEGPISKHRERLASDAFAMGDLEKFDKLSAGLVDARKSKRKLERKFRPTADRFVADHRIEPSRARAILRQTERDLADRFADEGGAGFRRRFTFAGGLIDDLENSPGSKVRAPLEFDSAGMATYLGGYDGVDRVRESAASFGRLVDRSAWERELPKLRFFRDPSPKDGHRAYHDRVSNLSRSSGHGWLNVGKGGRTTIFHELGHELEDAAPRIADARRVFYSDRTRGETTTKLSKLTGNKKYGAREVAKPDKWTSPYTGKIYDYDRAGGDTASEILSMGVQRWQNAGDLAAFYEDDREHFAWTYAAIRGRFSRKLPTKTVASFDFKRGTGIGVSERGDL